MVKAPKLTLSLLKFLPVSLKLFVPLLALQKDLITPYFYNGYYRSYLRMYVREKQADLKNVGRRGSADLHHIYVA